MRDVGFRNDKTADTSRKRSPALWQGCPSRVDVLNHAVDAMWDGDDFEFTGDEDGNDTAGYERYIDTSNTIRQLATDTTALATGSRGGVLRLVNDGTDNDSPTIQRTTATGATGPWLLGNTAGCAWPMWFEARVRTSSIVDDVSAWFCGFATGSSVCADNGLLTDDTGDIVDSLSAIGFRTVHTNSGTTGTNAVLEFAYQDGGQTSPIITLTAIATLVASTWIKVGFRYNPKAPASKQITLFFNNIEQSTYITTTNIDATTFPENDPMCFTFGQKAGTGTSSNTDIDWWYACQVYDDNFGAS